MAKRPIFIPVATKDESWLVYERGVEFQWHPGLAPSQKKKNVVALHNSAREKGITPLLEISTKSDCDLGVRLSAFNLTINIQGFGFVSLESAFQGGKIFKDGGPYTDLYGLKGSTIKKDKRLTESGGLKGFIFEKHRWSLEPKTAFYDWLYINAISKFPSMVKELRHFKGFTDIEFNPKKSINCQARSCALFVSLASRGLVNKSLVDPVYFINILKKDIYYNPGVSANGQAMLF